MIEVLLSHYAIFLWTVIFGGITIRLTMCLPSYYRPRLRKRKENESVSTMVIWGSGGHTTEMILLLKKLKVEKFHPIFNVLANSPIIPHSTWHRIIRSREVKQSWITTLWTTLLSCFHSVYLIFTLQPTLILCNGPGTCVPLCYAAFFFKFLGIYTPTIIFVESFCRVEKLSLTGKLLYYIVDKFIVQWPALLKSYPRAEYLGDL